MPTATLSFVTERCAGRLLSGLLCGLATLLLAWPASAQWRDPSEQFGPELRRFADPLDDSVFEARSLLSTNGLGGYDSDGCSYAKGQQPRTFGIATSPTTGFSAPVGSFPTKLTASQKKAVRAVLADFGSIETILALPASGGYEIAAAIARVLGRSHFEVGELYLAGAWTVRDSIVGFFPGLQGAGDTWRKMKEVSKLAQQQTEDRARTRAMFDLARLSHRGGFFHERETFLELLSTFPDAGLGAMEKRAEFRRRVAEEGRLLGLAREEFRAGLASNQGNAGDRSYYRYLTGDIDRRRGDFEAGSVALQEVAAHRSTAEEVATLARDILRVLEVQDKSGAAYAEPTQNGDTK